jgi:hypothetical protein
MFLRQRTRRLRNHVLSKPIFTANAFND